MSDYKSKYSSLFDDGICFLLDTAEFLTKKIPWYKKWFSNICVIAPYKYKSRIPHYFNSDSLKVNGIPIRFVGRTDDIFISAKGLGL